MASPLDESQIKVFSDEQKQHETFSTKWVVPLQWAKANLMGVVVTTARMLVRTVSLADDNTSFGAQGHNMLHLPPDLSMEVARALNLPSLAAVAATCTGARRHFWQDSEVWQARAVQYGLDLCHASINTEIVQNGDCSAVQAFRRGLFHLDGRRLNDLEEEARSPSSGSEGHVAILTEATHMIRGLMPCDGLAMAETLIRTAERALQAHDPLHTEAAAAARDFLQVAQQRSDVFSTQQLEQLESAHSSALQLQELMELALQRERMVESQHHGFLQANCDGMHCMGQSDGGDTPSDISVWPALLSPAISSTRSSQSSSPRIAERDFGIALDDAHEERRLLEIDMLLERLQQHSALPSS